MGCRQEISHDDLMARFKKRSDETAFERILCDYTPPAAALAHQMLRDSALAEDAVQEAFVRVIRKRRQYVSSRPFSHWFYAILRNICVDMLRKRQREKNAIQHLTHRIKCYVQKEPPTDCMTLLNALPLHERCVLELRAIHSMTFEEIAVALDISQEAAKKRAQRGLRKLRKQMEHNGHVRRQAV
jgi:RNA polymerase sigma-70 factor (ECF subfamily)